MADKETWALLHSLYDSFLLVLNISWNVKNISQIEIIPTMHILKLQIYADLLWGKFSWALGGFTSKECVKNVSFVLKI